MSVAGAIARSADLSERVQRRVRGLQIRTRYRLGLPLSTPGVVRMASSFRHPIDATRRVALAARYRELFPEGVDGELEEAARLRAHRFTLLGHTMIHGERIAWSRDPVSGREWSRGFSGDISYRGDARLGDIKLPWELSKHQYFFTLGKAAWLSGDTGAADEIVQQIDHWNLDNPYCSGVNWISALEVGTRAVSWIVAYPFYADRCDARFRGRMVASIAQHVLFVEQHLSTGQFANTHLAGEAAALVIGALFLDSRHSARWLATGLRILDAEMARQVTADGVHAERSVAYHRFFLDQYYLVAAFLAANGQSLPPHVLDRIQQMTAFLMHAMLPDGTAPAFGDGDDARGLWCRADCPGDYRGLLALGAVLFKRGDFKWIAGGVREEVLWMLGERGVAAFEAMTASPPAETSIAYREGGYYVLRGGWEPTDAVLVFDCGQLGFGPARHGHADALSFQLHAEGYPFLVDSGTYSYNLDYAWRDAFRLTRAHNTVVVDGADQSIPDDRMSWTRAARSRTRAWVTTRWFDLVDGSHDGYTRLPDPVTHRRVVVFLKPDVWVICDELHAAGPHRAELLLHVRPDCAVDAGSRGEDVRLTSPAGLRLTVWMAADRQDAPGFDVIAGGEQERGAWFSPRYGTRVPSRALSATRDFSGQCRVITCVSASDGVRPVVIERDGGIDIRVTREPGCEDRLFYDGRTRSGALSGLPGVLFERTVAGAPQDSVRVIARHETAPERM